MKKNAKPQRFFAAANGYNGFKSYFNKIFSPFDYSSIYILKGGPGTGKSTLMKKAISKFEGRVDKIEAIHCSSDPASLDGVIIQKSGCSVAIIDGTAPHMTDPEIPGASEKIVNLGEAFDNELLKNNRRKIEKSIVKKKKHYNSAYEHLCVAGRIASLCFNPIKEMYSASDDDIIKSIIAEAIKGDGKAKYRLISAYGKNGFSHLDTLQNIADKIYTPVGLYGSEYVFMEHLFSELKREKADMIVCPSPLDEEKIEGIYIVSSSVAIVAEKESAFCSGEVIDTAQFLDHTSLLSERNNLEFFRREREVWLWNAAEQFKMASDAHFELEDIYTAAMNFSIVDEFFDKMTSEIEKTLSIN